MTFVDWICQRSITNISRKSESLWKNIAGKSDNGDSGVAGHSRGDDVDYGGGGVYRGCSGGGGPLK